MTHRVRVYPHNDLSNLAHYQRETINKKIAESNEDGIDLDCLSCLISLAFSVEALLNFVGYKKVKNWKERQPYRDKMVQVCKAVGLQFSQEVDPYKTLWELKELRDSIAHGQPIEVSAKVRNREELRKAMECPWDKNLNAEYINQTYKIVVQFEKDLLEKGKISLGETLTSAVSAGYET